MAFPREPDEPYHVPPSDDEIRRRATANDRPPQPSRFDEDLQPDLELREGPVSSGRTIAYAIAALLIVGAVLYGIAHTSSTNTASTTSPPSNSNTAANTPPPAPPPVRDVTPGPNATSGTTTGAAPSAPAAPPQQNNPAPAR